MSQNKVRELSWKEIWKLTKTSFSEFIEGNSFMHGAALAYYAIFALVPIIYLTVTSFGLFIGQDEIIAIVGELLEDNVGISDVSAFTDLMYEWEIGKGGTLFLRIVGIGALIFISTAMFNSLRNSLNFFFGIEPEKRFNIVLETLLQRLLSFGLMALFGAIIIVVYFVQSILVSFGSEILSDGSFIQELVINILEHISMLLINFLLFAFVFKYLHGGKIQWKLAMGGALLTAILLYLGQLLINYYLANFFFAAKSGIAGTLMALLTYIFYTSQIIFIGAKFTSVYARMVGKPIVPKK